MRGFLATALTLAGVATLAAAPNPAAAQPPPADGRPGGPGGPPGGGPGFGPGTFFAPAVLAAADADKDGKLAADEAGRFAAQLVRSADGDGKGSVDAAALGRAINKLLGPPPGVGPDGPGGDFGPGTMLAPRILAAVDADKDGRVAPDEAARGAERFVRDADPKSAGGVDEAALAGAINGRMGPPGGFGGPGGPMAAERAILKDYDKTKDGRLDAEERRVARAALKAERDKNPRGGGGFGPPGGPGGFGGGRDEPVSPGARMTPADVAPVVGKKLYDADAFRTFFFDFEDADWEQVLEDFHATDVEVPATLTVDGKKYPGVGIHFRGMSSYMAVRAGHKRSLNVAIDHTDAKQRLDGYKTLNLLNSHEDGTFLHSVLFLQIAREHIPAPKANFARVVINGEDWGVYVNAQQFDKILLAENYPSDKGARWKVRGNPGADGGLTYVGDDVAEYRKRYDLKSDDDAKSWKALIALCKTLNQTPPERLEAALRPILDLDGVLWFLALDNALINGDGYWTRASDYSIYRDPKGVFHVLPHDANETFGPPMMFGPPGGFGNRGGRPGGPGGGPPPAGAGGPGGPGGPPGGGPRPGNVDLDPLVGLDDARKPLRSKLLAVPALRERYLRHVRSIAENQLDWAKLGPVVAGYRDLIAPAIAADTRKLTSTAAFLALTADAPAADAAPDARPMRGPAAMPLRTFADRRRQALLANPEIGKVKP